MKNRSGEKIKLASIDELLGVVNEEAAMDIEIYKISGFKGHPFKVVDDEKMQELVESIKVNGVLSPVLIRPTGMDTYEMISGHRRLHAAELAGLTAIPSIIREMTDDEAMAEQTGESARSIQRYIRLTELIPELLEYLDLKRVQFTSAVEISYLDKEIQKWLFEYIRDNGLVKPKQIALLRKMCETGIMTEGKLIAILNDSQPGRTPSTKNLISEKKLRKYFPADYTEEDMRSVIVELLEQWSQGKESE